MCILRNPVTSMILGNELQYILYSKMTIKITKMNYDKSLMHKLQGWPVALFLSTKHVYLRWSLSLTTARELYDIIYCKIFDLFLFSEILNMLLKLFFQRHLLSYETYDVNVLPCFEILYLRPKMSPQLTRLSIPARLPFKCHCLFVQNLTQVS